MSLEGTDDLELLKELLKGEQAELAWILMIDWLSMVSNRLTECE